MEAHLTEPEIALRALLAAGPRDSREVVSAMAERGLSAKQTRTAREKQNVIIERAGSGADMRSTWRLQDLIKPDIAQPRSAEAGQVARASMTTMDCALETAGEKAVVPVSGREGQALQRATRQPHALSPETQAIVQACRARGIPVTVRQVRVASVRIPVRTEAEAPPAAPAPVLRAEPASRDPLQRSRDIGRMDHDELRAYAKQIGVPQRDIEHLTLDRLRQNCALTVASLIEAYME